MFQSGISGIVLSENSKQSRVRHVDEFFCPYRDDHSRPGCRFENGLYKAVNGLIGGRGCILVDTVDAEDADDAFVLAWVNHGRRGAGGDESGS